MSAELGELGEVQTSRGTLRAWVRGEGAPIVLVHGLGVNGLLWRKVVPILAEEYRCIVPELPLGAHRIPMPRDADLTTPGLAGLLNAFLESLDLSDVTVVANDTGGAIAQLLVTRHPERVGRLVLTPTDALENFLPPRFRYLQIGGFIPGVPFITTLGLRLGFVRNGPLAYGPLVRRPIPRSVTDDYVAAVGVPGVRRDVAKVLRGIRKRYTIEAAKRFGEFRRPVLVAWHAEEKDPIFPLKYGRRLAELFPDARLVTIEDSLGFLPEDQPERLAEEIRKFLAETS